MSWYTLAGITEAEKGITARFIPDTFLPNSDCPVLVVTVVGPIDRLAATQAFEVFRESLVVDYSATPVSFSAMSDGDWEERTVQGSAVEIAHEPYAVDELLGIARDLASLFDNETDRNLAMARKMESVEHFVLDLIARAETKKSLSSKAAPTLEGQLDVLNRVLNRIKSD
ncbi:hypothetical protein LAG73_11275 [Pseudoxanthomonas japonensis]|nr:hypothetical protein LAG73_11275 [Pseudoxanthomonas japonensis]